jgi:hypothetical protein
MLSCCDPGCATRLQQFPPSEAPELPGAVLYQPPSALVVTPLLPAKLHPTILAFVRTLSLTTPARAVTERKLRALVQLSPGERSRGGQEALLRVRCQEEKAVELRTVKGISVLPLHITQRILSATSAAPS